MCKTVPILLKPARILLVFYKDMGTLYHVIRKFDIINPMRSLRKTQKPLKTVLFFVLFLYLCLCLSMQISVHDTTLPEEDCTLYYIVNADGMKGLGHSILLLTDQNGCGTVLSFNGMQCSLGESLLGKAGVGKMSTGTMSAEEVTAFLRTGDLHLDGDQLNGNYDWALYRPVSAEDCQAVLAQAQVYIRTQERFQDLYSRWALTGQEAEKAALAQEMEAMSRDKTLPLYRIYTNNCDHVARELAGSADDSMQDFNMRTWHRTPNGNLKAFSRMAPQWGAVSLGENSLTEKLLEFFIIF